MTQAPSIQYIGPPADLALDDILVGVAARIEQIRKDRGLSQSAFAKQLGVSRSAYQHYCRGTHEIPSSLLGKLHVEHGVDPYWLLTGEEVQLSPGIEAIRIENAIDVALAFSEALPGADLSDISRYSMFALKFIFNRGEPIENPKEAIAHYIASIGVEG